MSDVNILKSLRKYERRKNMRNPINALRRGIHFLPCYLEIKRMPKNISLEKLVDKTFNSWGEILSPLQVKSEIIGLLKILKKKKPKVILEIGTAKGGTLFLFSRVAHEDSIIISLDLPKGEFGGGYSIFKIPLYKSFSRENQKIHLVRADSHKEETLKKIKSILRGKKVDFLFIDGDHTYKGVKTDFKVYSPLVRESGIIVFHDVAKVSSGQKGNVRKFWKEVKSDYKKEIIEDEKQGWGGIGIIKKNKKFDKK